MSEQRQFWTPHAWAEQALAHEDSDRLDDADVDAERSPTTWHFAVRPTGGSAPVLDAAPISVRESEPSSATSDLVEADVERIPMDIQLPSTSVRRETAPHRRQLAPRWVSTALAVLLLLVTNVGLQLNRRSFDVLSEHFPDAALARVQRCESLGHMPDVLYMGSSLTMHAVAPTQVDASIQAISGRQLLSCNVAEDGSTFEEDYYTLKRVIEDGFAPKLIVETLWEYNVDLRTKPYADANGLPAEQILSLADMSDVGALAAHFGSGLGGKLSAVSYVAGKTIPFYGDRIAIFKSLCGGSTIGPCATTISTSVVASPLQNMVLPPDSRGWVGLTGRSLATYSAAQLRPYSSCGDHCPLFVMGGHQPAFLSKLITLARAHGIRVALVIPPFSRYFFNVLRPADWQRLVSFWESFVTGPGISFYDESHDPAYQDTDFWDVHHLDTDGAAKFSAWLGQTLIPRELITA